MFCTKCGKKLFDEAIFCPDCGTPTANHSNVTEEVVETVEEFKASRNPDAKMLYHIGEITEKFPFSPNLEYGDFYFEENELIIDSFASAAKVKTGTVRGSYTDFQFKTLTSRMLLNKFKVLVISTEGFTISLYAPDGLIGKQIDGMLSSGASGSLAEYNATISKLEKIIGLLNL